MLDFSSAVLVLPNVQADTHWDWKPEYGLLVYKYEPTSPDDGFLHCEGCGSDTDEPKQFYWQHPLHDMEMNGPEPTHVMCVRCLEEQVHMLKIHPWALVGDGKVAFAFCPAPAMFGHKEVQS